MTSPVTKPLCPTCQWYDVGTSCAHSQCPGRSLTPVKPGRVK